MAHIAILVESLQRNGTTLNINGCAFVSVSGSPSISWGATVSFTSLSATMNEAIRDAAIAAAESAGYSVGPLDNKTVFSGAMGV